MMYKFASPMEWVYTSLIYLILAVLALLCVFPMIHIFAISLSASAPADSGAVTFWPVGFNWQSYLYIMDKPNFLRAFGVTLQRAALGVSISMTLTVLAAYPLSKEKQQFRLRTWYAWIFVFNILFHGGLIPFYMTVRNLGMIDTIWALVVPSSLSVFNILILLNFFRGLPKEMEEAATVDGASHWKILFRIFIPMSTPAIATLTLFTIVSHWNAWFDGLIFMNSPNKYPLASYLQTAIIGRDQNQLSPMEAMVLTKISERTTRAAQIFAGALPVLIIYPFLQRYFVKGIVLGSVKG